MSNDMETVTDSAEGAADALRDLLLPLEIITADPGGDTPETTTEEAPEHVRARYLEDLRLIMRLPGGAGLRVLRRWLDEAQAYAPLSLPAPQIYAATALFDYARERMAEAVVADPVGFLRIHLAGVRRCAGHSTPNP